MHLRAHFFRSVIPALGAVLATAFPAFAQTTPPKPAATAPSASRAAESAPQSGTEHFVGTAANLGPATGDKISIDLLRWSSPEERDALATTAVNKAPSDLGAALKALPNLGYLWRSGSGVGAVIRHAASWKDASGEHVILATDSDLNIWKQDPAKPVTTARPFTVLEIVIPATGVGAGKLSIDAKVTGDVEHKTLRIDGYAAVPVMVTGIKRMRGTP